MVEAEGSGGDVDEVRRGVGVPEARHEAHRRFAFEIEGPFAFAALLFFSRLLLSLWLFLFASFFFPLLDQRVDPVAVPLGVLQPLDDEDHRSVSGRAALPAVECLDRAPVNAFAGEVDGADERRVELAAAQRPHREREGNGSRGLSRLDRERAPAQVELRAEPVGGDVRHRPDDRSRLEDGNDGVSRPLEPLHGGPGFAGRAGEAPARAPPGDLGVGLHPDEDPGPLARQRPAPGERLGGGAERGELLRQRLAEILRRKAQPLEIQLDGTHPAFSLSVEEALVREERLGESRPIRGARHGAAEPDDGEHGSRSPRSHGSPNRAPFGPSSSGASSETIRWALFPPKPNAETAAILGPSHRQGSSRSTSRKGEPSSAAFGSSA